MLVCNWENLNTHHVVSRIVESYSARFFKIDIYEGILFSGDKNGRAGGIRTRDPLVPNQMRYQLRYGSTFLLTSS